MGSPSEENYVLKTINISHPNMRIDNKVFLFPRRHKPIPQTCIHSCVYFLHYYNSLCSIQTKTKIVQLFVFLRVNPLFIPIEKENEKIKEKQSNYNNIFVFFILALDTHLRLYDHFNPAKSMEG
jgi:hypothetical protein